MLQPASLTAHRSAAAAAQRQRRRLMLGAAHLVVACAGLLWAYDAPAQGVTADTVTVGHSLALSGPLGDLGQEVTKGAKAYLATVNAKGGVHGRKIELITKDDAYDSKKTLENVDALINKDGVFALFNTFGTPNNEALIPVARKAGVPVITPYTGAPSVRNKEWTGVFNVRASYGDEAERMVEHLATLGTKKIGIAYQNNAFGKEFLAAATDALKRREITPVAIASVENSAADAPAAVDKLVAAQPEAVLLGLAGKPTIETIRGIKQKRPGLQMYALSVLATPANLKTLGADGTGVAITQVMPYPASTSLAIVREFQTAMKAAGHDDFNHLSLEGFVNAKVLTEGLRRAGRGLTRASFEAAMNGMRKYDVGGLEISFGQGAASGSRFVELTMVNSRGNLIK